MVNKCVVANCTSGYLKIASEKKHIWRWNIYIPSIDKVSGFQHFDCSHSLLNYSFKCLDENVQYFNLVFTEQTDIPTVLECISINKELQVNLTYKGYSIPLPEWFRSGHSCKLTRFSMLENFASYVRNKGTEFNGILEELNNIKFYQPKGRPKYSTRLIRFALLLRYNSCQTYTVSFLLEFFL